MTNIKNANRKTSFLVKTFGDYFGAKYKLECRLTKTFKKYPRNKKMLKKIRQEEIRLNSELIKIIGSSFAKHEKEVTGERCRRAYAYRKSQKSAA